MCLYYTGWRTKCHTIDCARNTFLLLQKHMTSGTELILIGWKIVPNEEHVQCDHRFASQPLAKRTLAFVTTFRHKSSESARHNFTMWALSCATFSGLLWRPENVAQLFVCKRLWGKMVVTLNMFFIKNNFPAYED